MTKLPTGKSKRSSQATALSRLRQSNEKQVMSVLRRQSGTANADIARLTELAPQTVSLIVNDLTSRGLITESASLKGKRGQPARPRLLRGDGAYSFGCEISWKYVEVVLLDLSGAIIKSYHRDYDYPDYSSIFDEITNVLDEIKQVVSTAHHDRIVGLGVAMPTNIWANIVRLNPPESVVQGWRHTNVAQKFEELTGLETKVVNDGSAACRAEQAFGIGTSYPDFCYFFISHFINGGLVIANNIFNGPTGNSGNLGGILVLDRSGKPEYVHLIASLFALENNYLGKQERTPDPEDIDAWTRPEVDSWVDDSSHALALAIANCGAVVESPVAIIDGLLPKFIRESLVAQTEEIFKHLPNTTFDHPLILEGEIGRFASSIGAAELLFHSLYFSTYRM